MSPKKICFIEFTIFIISTFLHFRSSSVSSNVPNSLHFFHVSFPFLLMVYSSVFSSFIMRSHELNFDGSVFFAYSIFLMPDEIWLISSAYSMFKLISALMYAYWWSFVASVCWRFYYGAAVIIPLNAFLQIAVFQLFALRNPSTAHNVG